MAQEVITLEDWSKTLPEGIKLYDFGGGVLSRPSPDDPTRRICYLTSVIDGERYSAGTELSPPFSDSITIPLDEAVRAVLHYQNGLAEKLSQNRGT